MPLLEIDHFRDRLICPRCASPIEGDLARCTRCSLDFPVVGGRRVFVDFDKSVLDRVAVSRMGAASPIPRITRRGLSALAASLIQGHNQVARRQMKTFVRLTRQLHDPPLVLVVGGAAIGSGLGELYGDETVDLIAFDIYRSEFVQFIADGHSIPLSDRSVDGVIVQAVLEHVIDPHQVVREIERVLRPEGVVYSETPFLQHVHEGRYDFCRFTESGHRYLFRHFRELDAGVVGGLGVQTIWSFAYLFRGLFRSTVMGRAIRVLLFWLRWLDRVIPTAYAIDGASGCYFLGTLSGTTLSPRELIARYRGAFRS